jgi:hypothetical protein
MWKDYFSFNEIKAISESPTKMVAASENALFSKNLASGEINTSNTIDGLSGETISTLYYSMALNKTIVGYKNGLVIVINEKDKGVYKAIGILQKQIPDNVKKINSFYENNGILYISCLFGIVQFNLNTNEFGDTYFLGATTNDYQEVLQTTVLDNDIYAVTRNNGIKKGSLTNPNLNDYSQWQVFDSNYWNGIATLNNQLLASRTNNVLYKFIGNVANPFFTASQVTLNFKVYNNKLIVTNSDNVYVFDDQLLSVLQVNNTSVATIAPTFSCAGFINNSLYIGTLENGLFITTLQNPTFFDNITPNGPIRNAIFSMNASSGKLWACYGGYNTYYNPHAYNPTQPNNINNPNKYGISQYAENGWQNTPFSGVMGAMAISSITVNPKNSSQIYFNSFHSGLLKTTDGIPSILYNQTNSLLTTVEDAGPPYVSIRVGATAFDKNGNLWVTNSRNKKGIKVLKADNTWQAISVEPVSSQYSVNSYINLVIDKNNTKWMSTEYEGVLAYNENGNVFKKINYGPSAGNLPAYNATALAIDNKNQLWIGTKNGLRIVSSVDAFLQPGQINATNIVISEEGIGQELFYEQNIRDIVVDGANRKWVATVDSGVFLISPNGQQTIYHFTSQNSPLPSNFVMDVEIDPNTGEVFLATDKGMISFKGVSTKGKDNLEAVFIYPNPVRPEDTDTVKISGLLDKATVKITDIEGNLVHEATSEGGTIEWDTTAFGKYKVASGVYMVFISANDGIETKVKKLMIVR